MFFLVFCVYAFSATDEVPMTAASVVEESDDQFYVFGLGQGNSQLAIYKNSGIGVLYDCGSTSQKTHPKLIALGNNEFLEIFVRKHRNERVLDFGTVLLTRDSHRSPDANEDSSRSRTPESGSLYTDTDARTADIKEDIKTVVLMSEIKHLFIFVSHPDADHYNKIIQLIDGVKEKSQDVLFTVVLGGDWFGDINDRANSGKENSTTKRIEFVKKLSGYEKVWVELPYYWKFKGRSGTPVTDYKTLMRQLHSSTLEHQDQRTPISYSFFQTQECPNNSPDHFQGNLKTLIEYFCQNREIRMESEDFNNHFKDVISEPVLNDVRILLMNQRFDDVNSQSTIVSMRMPTLNMQFVCTGDAHDETFHHQFFDNSTELEALYPTDKFSWTNVLILPHHGSSTNLSRKMIEIFQPDLLVVSAGNGVQYGHPNKMTIDYYRSKNVKRLMNSQFFAKFQPRGMANVGISYTGKNFGRKGSVEKLLNNPILFTSIHKTFKFDRNGIYSKFTNVISVESNTRARKFCVDFSSQVQCVGNEKSGKKRKTPVTENIIGNGIVERQGVLYFKVDLEGGMCAYYEAVEIL